MYCPKCGTRVKMEDQLFGGCCQWGCETCKFAMNCRDVFTGELKKDTEPLFNPLKAWQMRRKYKKRKK